RKDELAEDEPIVIHDQDGGLWHGSFLPCALRGAGQTTAWASAQEAGGANSVGMRSQWGMRSQGGMRSQRVSMRPDWTVGHKIEGCAEKWTKPGKGPRPSAYHRQSLCLYSASWCNRFGNRRLCQFCRAGSTNANEEISGGRAAERVMRPPMHERLR